MQKILNKSILHISNSKDSAVFQEEINFETENIENTEKKVKERKKYQKALVPESEWQISMMLKLQKAGTKKEYQKIYLEIFNSLKPFLDVLAGGIWRENKRFGRSESLEEITSGAKQGLAEAIQRWTYEKQNPKPLSVYAYTWINWSALEVPKENNPNPIKIPEKIQKAAWLHYTINNNSDGKVVNTAIEKLNTITETMSKTSKNRSRYLGQSIAYQRADLEKPIGNENGTDDHTLRDILPCPKNQIHQQELKELREFLRQTIIEKLNPEERFIIQTRTGMNILNIEDFKGMSTQTGVPVYITSLTRVSNDLITIDRTEIDRKWTLEELGDTFNYTRERIRQIQNKAMKKLRVHLTQKTSYKKEFENYTQIVPSPCLTFSF